MTNAQQLLKQGQDLREAGQTFEALDAINRSLEVFSKEQNHQGFAHALIDRAICWQHLYQTNDHDQNFAVLYKKDAEAALEISTQNNIPIEQTEAYYISGKAEGLFGNYAEAVRLFHLAIDHMTPDRQAQRGDWMTNLGKALYRSGEKAQGFEMMQKGIEQIKNHEHEVEDYPAQVWLSGGYMRLAEVLQQDDPKQSEKYLAEAQKIVDAHPDQIMRKKQMEIYLKTRKSGL